MRSRWATIQHYRPVTSPIWRPFWEALASDRFRMALIVQFSDYRRRNKGRVFFNRAELSQLLSVYSERVAAGEWRDYAIDQDGAMAVFSIFRHTSERAAFSVCKTMTPKGTVYSVFDAKKRLKRSSSLADALGIFERRPRLVHD